MAITVILTDPGVGGTFLTWSIHYLAGHTQYFNHKINHWVDLPSDPLTNSNAHNFKPNQPNSYDEFQFCLTSLLNCETSDFHTMYFHTFGEFPPSNDFVETQKAITDVGRVATRTVVLTNQLKNSLYQASFRQRHLSTKSFIDPSRPNLTNQEQLDDFINYFFKDSAKTYQSLNLTQVWDQREFLALNVREEKNSIARFVDLSIDHWDVDCLELFNTGDLCMRSLFDYLDLDIDPVRFATWIQIYQEWRKIHYNRLNFLWCFDKIVDYILNGYCMDLTHFDLDIVQEAAIQQELIYKHNLNLKTWQLEKFTSTQQLHQLLEPNTHTLK
jgi:hypothetical protein